LAVSTIRRRLAVVNIGVGAEILRSPWSLLKLHQWFRTTRNGRRRFHHRSHTYTKGGPAIIQIISRGTIAYHNRTQPKLQTDLPR